MGEVTKVAEAARVIFESTARSMFAQRRFHAAAFCVVCRLTSAQTSVTRPCEISQTTS